MNGQFSRPALNQNASIGALYDAKRDSFLPQSFLKDKLSPGAVTLHDARNVDVQERYGDSYATRLEALHVGPDLSASIMTGLVSLEGIGEHITERAQAMDSSQASVYHTITTVQAKLDLSNQGLKSCVSPVALQTGEPTHIVVGVDYGTQSVVTLRQWLRNGQTKEEGDSQLQQKVVEFITTVKDTGGNLTHIQLENFDRITAYSTILASEEIVLNDTEEAKKFLQIVALQVQRDNSGRGRPILYRMLPVQMLSLFNLADVDGDKLPTMPSQDCMKKFVQVCDEFQARHQLLQGYDEYVSANKFHLPAAHIQDVKQRLVAIQSAEQRFRAEFGQRLYHVRSGQIESEKLWQCISDASQGPNSPNAISTLSDDYRWKLDLINEMTRAGATYLGYNGLDIRTQLAKRGDGRSFVLYFGEKACQEQDLWNMNKGMMLSLLDDHKAHDYFFGIVDCDAIGLNLEKSIISEYEGSTIIVHDLQEEQQYLAGHCFARRYANTLETDNVPKPLKRRFVNIPCPGQNCSGGPCDWRCSSCHASLEYGYTDQYIYCDCGRSE